MDWVILIASGVLEAVWATALGLSNGFKKLVPTIIFVIAAIGSLGGLGIALHTLPTGTAYAVWTGIGSLGAFFVGVYVFGDTASLIRWVGIALVVAGIVSLKMG